MVACSVRVGKMKATVINSYEKGLGGGGDIGLIRLGTLNG